MGFSVVCDGSCAVCNINAKMMKGTTEQENAWWLRPHRTCGIHTVLCPYCIREESVDNRSLQLYTCNKYMSLSCLEWAAGSKFVKD